jgi:FKBP-type peptidyl-prolyl cis-trans isomerase
VVLLGVAAGLCLGPLGCGEGPDPDEAKATTTESGLKYFDLKVGDGAEAKRGSWVEVEYVGKLRDGKQFDSTRDHNSLFGFVVGYNQVIKGWDEGVLGMKEGGKRKLWIPAKQAYGAKPPANGPIPPDADLLFEIDVVRVRPGLVIQDIQEGTGRAAARGDALDIQYVGTLRSGFKFDSTYDKGQPFTLRLGGGIIKGMDFGLIGMKEGGKRKLVICPELAYGDQPRPKIPAGSELTFEVELLKIH